MDYTILFLAAFICLLFVVAVITIIRSFKKVDSSGEYISSSAALAQFREDSGSLGKREPESAPISPEPTQEEKNGAWSRWLLIIVALLLIIACVVVLFARGCSADVQPANEATDETPSMLLVEDTAVPTPSSNTGIEWPGRITFSANFDGDLDIYYFESGGEIINLTDNIDVDDFAPSWSPEGDQIAFASKRGGSIGIYLMDPNGNNITQIPSMALSYDPSWSPNGEEIVFKSYRDIFIMRVDGTGVVRLTHDSAIKQFPDWSPISDKILFQSDIDGDMEIFVVNRDGTGLTQLTFNETDDWNPTWSPDGSRILFTNDGNIWVMDFDGMNPIQLTDYSETVFSPAWSPDGELIVFTKTDFAPSMFTELFIMNFDGTDVHQISDFNSGIIGYPTWRP